MPISALPTPPSRQDPTNFNDRADAFLGALPLFQSEANTLQTDVNSKQTQAATSATNADASALAAASTAGASIWVSGTTYAVGNNRFSPLNFLTYRRKTAGAGTTDPSLDSTNWQLLTGLGDVSTTGNQTIDGVKTFSNLRGGSAATTPVVVTFSATSMTINCVLSNVFTTTFTANVTTAPALSNPIDGQTINWFITQDATGGRTIVWPTSFKWAGGATFAGVLSTSANAVDLVVATYRSATGFWYVSLAKGFA